MAEKSCGLLIRIEKNMLGDRKHSENYVMGYFDRLMIEPVKQWFDFSPHKTSLSQNNGPLAVSSYPIKLIFPSDAITDELRKSGWDYEDWQENPQELIQQFPCVTVALINLTDKFKGTIPRDTCNKQLLRLSNMIHQTGRFDTQALRDAHICILPSLGYSDYCILSAEKGWHTAFELVQYLHQIRAENAPVLSTDYLMPVYHLNAEGKIAVPGFSYKDTQLSVRVNLKPGVSVRKLKEELGDIAYIYSLTGAEDCLLVSRDFNSFIRLLETLVDEQATSSFNNLVLNVESSFLLPSPTLTEKVEEQPLDGSNILDGIFDKVKESLVQYQALLKREQRHMRQFNAMNERMTAIRNICRESHNETIQRILEQWLLAFSSCLIRCTDGIEELIKKGKTQELELFWKNTEDAIEHFNERVGGFMADLSRSDCFFMESERYNHPSVGSATALLIAYNQWQNNFSKDVVRGTGAKESEYSFLIRSGGCDTTQTNNLFWFLSSEAHGNHLKEHLPLVIQMSEASLFDCGGTVLRMAHECMHFCGDRKRTQRMNYLFRFVSRLYGRVFADALLNREAFVGRLVRSLRDNLLLHDDNMESILMGHWTSCHDNLKEQFGKIILNSLHNSYQKTLQEDGSGWAETQYVSRQLCDWMMSELYDLFVVHVDEGGETDQFGAFLYRPQLDAAIKFCELCDVTLCKEGYSQCGLETRQYRIKRLNREDRTIRDSILISSINLVRNRLSASQPYLDKDKQLGSLNLWGIDHVLPEFVFEGFSESFADVEACLRLGVPLADYLLGFVFENWDLNIALPVRGSCCCRIPTVIKTCYPEYVEEYSLTSQAREELRAAVAQMRTHGMKKGPINADTLADRVNQLLEKSRDYEWEYTPLSEYLAECKKEYELNLVDQENMRPYREAFQKIRLTGIESDRNSVTAMFSKLTGMGGAE